jgi:hypothetical protein
MKTIALKFASLLRDSKGSLIQQIPWPNDAKASKVDISALNIGVYSLCL